MYISVLLNLPGGSIWFGLSSRRSLGDKTSKSLGSSDTLVRGRLLMVASTSKSKVYNCSSLWQVFRNCVRKKVCKIFLTVLIWRSQKQPWCEDAGRVLKVHLMPWLLVKLLSWSWSISLKADLTLHWLRQNWSHYLNEALWWNPFWPQISL